MANNFVFDPPKFLDPQKMLFAAGVSAGQSLADLGTGSGFYALSAGKLVGDQGVVYAVDILDSSLEHLSAEARMAGIRNIKTCKTNLENQDSCSSIATGTMDYVLLANVAHQLKNSKELFIEAYRMLKTGGKLVAIDWNDQPSPIGPPVTERIPLEQIRSSATDVNLKEAGSLPTDNYHYGLMFIK